MSETCSHNKSAVGPLHPQRFEQVVGSADKQLSANQARSADQFCLHTKPGRIPSWGSALVLWPSGGRGWEGWPAPALSAVLFICAKWSFLIFKMCLWCSNSWNLRWLKRKRLDGSRCWVPLRVTDTDGYRRWWRIFKVLVHIYKLCHLSKRTNCSLELLEMMPLSWITKILFRMMFSIFRQIWPEKEEQEKKRVCEKDIERLISGQCF